MFYQNNCFRCIPIRWARPLCCCGRCCLMQRGTRAGYTRSEEPERPSLRAPRCCSESWCCSRDKSGSRPLYGKRPECNQEPQSQQCSVHCRKGKGIRKWVLELLFDVVQKQRLSLNISVPQSSGLNDKEDNPWTALVQRETPESGLMSLKRPCPCLCPLWRPRGSL